MVNRQHEKVGKVKDVAIHNRVAYLVLSFEAAELSGKLYALPWSVVHFDNKLQVFVLDLSQTEVERLPVFENGSWPEISDVRANRNAFGDAGSVGDIPPF